MAEFNLVGSPEPFLHVSMRQGEKVVDNCNFFAIDQLDSLSESELYDLMLQEFPQWLEQAKAKQILN